MHDVISLKIGLIHMHMGLLRPYFYPRVLRVGCGYYLPEAPNRDPTLPSHPTLTVPVAENPTRRPSLRSGSLAVSHSLLTLHRAVLESGPN